MHQQYFLANLYYTELVDEFPNVTLCKNYYHNTEPHMDQSCNLTNSMTNTFGPNFEHTSHFTEEYTQEQFAYNYNPIESNHSDETDINLDLDLESHHNQGVQGKNQPTYANGFVKEYSYENNLTLFDETVIHPIISCTSAPDIYFHNQSVFEIQITEMKENESSEISQITSTANGTNTKKGDPKSCAFRNGIKIICSNCKTDEPRQWRNLNGEKMCNACWLYQNSHHRKRPFDLYNKTSKSRKTKKLMI
uniref:GATA-type domain-containing protein n=1 Tax=Rhabditophanes sp. KR3021 TaxID=114890 RepID=A0AC35UI87_9BILA